MVKSLRCPFLVKEGLLLSPLAELLSVPDAFLRELVFDEARSLILLCGLLVCTGLKLIVDDMESTELSNFDSE